MKGMNPSDISEYLIVSDSYPLWTDTLQAVGTIFAIILAIVTIVGLFKKDKARESEILSLKNIAQQLTEMMISNEKRYRLSKKPLLDIKVIQIENGFKLAFKNINMGSTIINFSVASCQPINFSKSVINSNEGLQFFDFTVTLTAPYETTTFSLEYLTDEGYSFSHKITVWWESSNGYLHSLTPIVDKELESGH